MIVLFYYHHIHIAILFENLFSVFIAKTKESKINSPI